MSRWLEQRAWRWRWAFAVVAAVVVACATVGVPAAAPASSVSPSAVPTLTATPILVSPPPSSGAVVFAQNCSGCHGASGQGGVGPPLAPAGFASLVSGMVTQGGLQMPSFARALTTAQIDAVATYVSQQIADPATHTANAADGGQIYRLYCAGCHSTTGRGGALTRGPNAPNIARFPAAEALAQMILGTANMPRFAGGALDVRQQASVALYVEVLLDPPSPGGRGLGYLGPVTEGAVGAVALLILIFIAVWLAWKSRKAVA